MTIRRTLAVLVACWFFSAAALWASDWSQWRGEFRDGTAHDCPRLIDSLPSEGLKPLWKTDGIPSAGDGGWGSPIVWDDKLYLFVHTRTKLSPDALPPRKYPFLAEDKRGGMSPADFAAYELKRREEDRALSRHFQYTEVVHCLDAKTGSVVWKDTQPSVYTRFLHSGSPTIVDGRLYVLAAGRVVRCLDARTGENLWSTKLSGAFTDEYMMSSFAVSDGVAAVLAGNLFGLDARTGSILWQGDAKTTKGTHSSPVTWRSGDREFFIVNVGGDSTACIEPRTGAEQWRVTSLAKLSTPVIVGDKVITLGDQRRGGLRCFDMTPTGATQRWAYQRIADKGSSPVVVDGDVYAQGERRMCCVNLDTGEEGWNTLLDLAVPQYTSLVAGDHKVIYAYDGMLVMAADSHEFRPLIAAKLDKSGLMASEAEFRRRLKLADVERTEGGLEKSLRLYQQQIGNQGPLRCSSPALVDGKLYVRLKQSIACYDLAAH